MCSLPTLPWESHALNSLDFPESPVCTQSPPCASFLASSLLNRSPSQSADACRVIYAGCLCRSLDHRLHQNHVPLVTCRPLYPHLLCPFEVLSRAWLIASFLTAASAPPRFWGRAADAHPLLLPFVIVRCNCNYSVLSVRRTCLKNEKQQVQDGLS